MWWTYVELEGQQPRRVGEEAAGRPRHLRIHITELFHMPRPVVPYGSPNCFICLASLFHMPRPSASYVSPQLFHMGGLGAADRPCHLLECKRTRDPHPEYNADVGLRL